MMTPENVQAPVQVGGDTDWDEVSPGYLTTCARKTSGKVRCWGHGAEDQLGNGMLMNSATPVEVLGF